MFINVERYKPVIRVALSQLFRNEEKETKGERKRESWNHADK